jgi:hypothetical protein
MNNLLQNSSFEHWHQGNSFAAPGDDSETADSWNALNFGGAGSVDRDTDDEVGRYAIQLTTTAAEKPSVYQDIADHDTYRRKTLTLLVKAKEGTLDKAQLVIDDGISPTTVNMTSISGYTVGAVVHTMAGTASALRVSLVAGTAAGDAGTVHFDSVMLLEGDWSALADYEWFDAPVFANDGGRIPSGLLPAGSGVMDSAQGDASGATPPASIATGALGFTPVLMVFSFSMSDGVGGDYTGHSVGHAIGTGAEGCAGFWADTDVANTANDGNEDGDTTKIGHVTPDGNSGYTYDVTAWAASGVTLTRATIGAPASSSYHYSWAIIGYQS